MNERIALLLKEHYKRLLPSFQSLTPSGMELDFFSYETNSQLKELFIRLHDSYDGFYVSGPIPLQILRQTGPKARTALILNAPIDVENTYRIILKQLLERPGLSVIRIGLDFLRFEPSLKTIIEEDRFFEVVRQYERRWLEFQTEEELEKEEQAVMDYYESQIRNGAVDVVISYFYSSIELAARQQIPAYYVYPSPHAFQDSMEHLKKSISLRRLRENLPACICFHLTEGKKGTILPDASFLSFLEELGRQISEQSLHQLLIQKSGESVEFYTDSATLRILTDQFQSCPFFLSAQEQTPYPLCVGYGIAETIYQAHSQAEEAARYGRNGGEKRGGSFLLDESRHLTVLLPSLKIPAASQIHIEESLLASIANTSRLSAETILRLLRVTEQLRTKDITSQDLVEHLGYSLRNANKILSRLEETGFACIAGQKRNGNKGRPVNVYRLLLSDDSLPYHSGNSQKNALSSHQKEE